MGTFTVTGDVNTLPEAYSDADGGSTSSGITVIIDDAKVANKLAASQVLRAVEARILNDTVYPPA
ncbi:hypothetical protein CMI37_10050 [Candidatus Pacearchaeota archaeon]|nr:hypothetical protein [Candidatus Pacearchaeota archaeon]|tara:strand:+ start:468 stop:662 length:195 start_codon:yes stop_codon:yes gene_type:complete